MRLTKIQTSIAMADLTSTLFVEGAAGVGKTTAGVRRLRHLLDNGVPAENILVFVPQKALAAPYQAELRAKKRKAGGEVTIATLGSLSLEMVSLFWPMIAESAGFSTARQPTFLSLELTQYYMDRVLDEQIKAGGWFEGIHISRPRLYSQISDNLNKAALVGLSYTEMRDRLKAAFQGDVAQEHIYDDALRCAELFRDFCKRNNTLDFALQAELFIHDLWRQKAPRQYLTTRYQHLIVDNVEEDSPAAHAIVADWLAVCQSALVMVDTEAGYRRFLGADAVTAYALKAHCREHFIIEKSYVMSAEVQALDADVRAHLTGEELKRASKNEARGALEYEYHRYYTQMLDWAVRHIAALVNNQGIPASEIVVLSPLLSDALRFALEQRLSAWHIPARTHRPSRALREEPIVRTCLTLARLAHPNWGAMPSAQDVSLALMSAIADLDWVRAQLLTGVAYRDGRLTDFDQLRADVRERVGDELGLSYNVLFGWLSLYLDGEPLPLDGFLRRLFGEVLAQTGFTLHQNADGARMVANLIDSAQNFRRTVSAIEPERETGAEYLRMAESGLIADQYVRDWTLDKAEEGVLIAPAYTYLMSNRPVDYQIWLNIGSESWAQRLYQPLTHPYVLSRQWLENRRWTDTDEQQVSAEILHNLASGLIRRCRKKVYLGHCQFGEQGYEQRGALADLMSRVLRPRGQKREDVNDV